MIWCASDERQAAMTQDLVTLLDAFAELWAGREMCFSRSDSTDKTKETRCALICRPYL
jgi:hypothetical protein